jgi:hypothetical protein
MTHPACRLKDLVLKWMPVSHNKAIDGEAPEAGKKPPLLLEFQEGQGILRWRGARGGSPAGPLFASRRASAAAAWAVQELPARQQGATKTAVTELATQEQTAPSKAPRPITTVLLPEQ